jgi:UDP-N-acetylglucosamine diphosphorylase/glucosamine-1-phosphate N-acetyltransferase
LGDPSLLFLEPGAKAQASIFNTQTGPIYLGKDSEVMEGCLVRGGLALCEGAGLKMGAKIYGPTTIGPHAKVGGEVNNSVILGYSNKGHEGFLGNSVLGEWCNLGADTNNSNLKNTYDAVDIWDYAQGRYRSTGLQFCGLFMGDHAKTGINTMLNTGTVVGVAANVFGGGFPPKFIPDFSWGGAEGLTTHRLDKALQTAKAVMARRNTPLTEAAAQLLQAVFQQTKAYRPWESQAKIAILAPDESS